MFSFLRRADIFSRSIRGEFVLYASSTAMMQASKLATALLAARILGPTTFGWWNSIQPFLLYGAMLNFGVLNGMNRDVPYFTGRGDAKYAKHIRKIGWGIALITAIVAATFSLGTSFFIRENPAIGSILRVIALALVFQQWYIYNSMLFISTIRFKLLSIQQITLAILFPVFSLILASIWGLNGFVLGQAIANLIVCSLMARIAHFDFRPMFDWKETVRLAKAGFPIMMAGFLYDTLRTLDRWVILTFLGPTQVGYYTLSILTLQAVTLLPRVVTAQFYPRISKRFGETHSYTSLKPLLLNTLKASLALILPFGLVIALSIKPFTQTFLSEYTPGISAALIVALGVTISRPVAGTAATFLNGVGKAKWYMLTQTFIIFIQLVLTISAVQLGWELNGVAWGVSATQILNMLILLTLVLYLIKNEHPAQKLL